MHVAEASVQTASQSSANIVIAALRGSTNNRAKVLELAVCVNSAPTTSLGLALAYSTALGVTPSGQMVGVFRDPAETVAATGQLEAAWATRPTVGASTTYFKRITLPPSIGSGWIWTWSELAPLLLAYGGTAAKGQLCLVQTTATAGGVLDVSCSWAE